MPRRLRLHSTLRGNYPFYRPLVSFYSAGSVACRSIVWQKNQNLAHLPGRVEAGKVTQMIADDVMKFSFAYLTPKMTLSVYACIQLVLIVLWNTSHAPKTSATTASASLNLVSAVLLILLSHFEHSKTIKPSDIINVYLFASLLLDIARVRTQWLLPNREDSVASILSISVLLKVVILCLEATEKRKYLISTFRNYSRESTSGIFNLLFFWWLNPLFLTGSGKVLSFEDLYAIDEALDSETIARSLQETWDNCIPPLITSSNLLLTSSRLEENRECSILLARKNIQATSPFHHSSTFTCCSSCYIPAIFGPACHQLCQQPRYSTQHKYWLWIGCYLWSCLYRHCGEIVHLCFQFPRHTFVDGH
jgi:hypothetical protein